jgi:hypothetical protein
MLQAVRPCREEFHFRKIVENVFPMSDQQDALALCEAITKLDMVTAATAVRSRLVAKGNHGVGRV